LSAIRLQPLTRAKVASLGDVGARWLAELPQVLAELEQRWSVEVGKSLTGGSCSYVAHATSRRGESVVVKVAIPSDDLTNQARTLGRADGRGYARLLEFDGALNAVLLEGLGNTLERSGRSPADQLGTLADTLRLAWQPVDPATGVDTATGAALEQDAGKAAGLHALISDLWSRLDGPCPERVVAQALDYADRLRRVDVTELVVVHGDPHPGNALAVRGPRPGAETGYCFVDDRAYDLGVAMRDWCGHLRGPDARRVAEGYADLLADRSGVDRDRIWQWGYLERVSTGLFVLSFGGTQLGRRFLESAERLVD
jgi:streptomycin 6-kinase